MIFVLKHLAEAGFEGAPKFLGEDKEGRIILSYIDGNVPIQPYEPWALSDELLVSVGKLLRAFHEVSATIPNRHTIDWPRRPSLAFGGETICHMDVSMSNVVCRGKEAIALIDFEELGLAAAVWDVARTARHWVPLIHPSDIGIEYGFIKERLVKRLALFLDAYKLENSERIRFLDAVLSNADESYKRMEEFSKLGHQGYAAEWFGAPAIRNRRGRMWVEENRISLERAIYISDLVPG